MENCKTFAITHSTAFLPCCKLTLLDHIYDHYRSICFLRNITYVYNKWKLSTVNRKNMYPVPNQNTMNRIRYLVLIANCCDFKNCILSISKIIMNQNLINSLVKGHSGQKKYKESKKSQFS